MILEMQVAYICMFLNYGYVWLPYMFSLSDGSLWN